MIGLSISSIAQMFAKLFDWRKTETEHQVETIVVKDIKDKDEALKDAIDALIVAYKYTDFMTVKDRFVFKHNFKTFLKEK